MKITVLGTGSWGSVMGQLLSNNGNSIILWQRFQEKVNKIIQERKLSVINDFTFSNDIVFTSDLKLSLKNAKLVIIAVPSHAIRTVLLNSRNYIFENKILVNLSKGLEESSMKTMSQVIEEVLNRSDLQIVSLYGPSHAEEVYKNIPTAMVAASKNIEAALVVQSVFSSRNLRVYTNEDILGVELGGSLKNVIAIAAGICDGIGFGDNTKAAILTRGIAEITRLGVAMGANETTFAGLSGIGDLFVTCSSRHSRNRLFGEKIGMGKTMEQSLSEMTMIVEGIRTSKALVSLCKKFNVEMPISNAVYEVLFQNKDPKTAVVELMSRDLKTE